MLDHDEVHLAAFDPCDRRTPKENRREIEAEARARATTIVADGEKRGAKIVESAKEQAQVEADSIIAAAKAEAAQEVLRAREALRNEVAALAVAGAEQILQREVDAAAHAKMLDQLKAKL